MEAEGVRGPALRPRANATYHAAVRRVPVTLLLSACGGTAPELDGVWESDRAAAAQVTIDGETVTMTVPGLKPTVYRQEIDRTATGYLLRWTKEDGEVLRVEARLDGDRLLLALDGQEFALRRKAAR